MNWTNRTKGRVKAFGVYFEDDKEECELHELGKQEQLLPSWQQRRLTITGMILTVDVFRS